jgi:NADH:ubiquinone oxidoreductase subunit K
MFKLSNTTQFTLQFPTHGSRNDGIEIYNKFEEIVPVNFLFFSGILILIFGILTILYNIEELIITLVGLELIILGLLLILIIISLELLDIKAQTVCIFLLVVGAVEAAISLTILINFYIANQPQPLR